ncbi:MAG: helix-turn-helix domain-containing protein [Deltaproteobacteria bacterium]
MSNKKQDKTKIVQIWGEILDEGFTSVPNILLRYRSRIGLKPKHIMLIIDIMSYKWDAGYPFPSYSTLGLRAGIEERSVKRITQDLEELGLLIKTPRFDGETGAQVTTVFDFRPLVQKLIEEMNKGEDLTTMNEEGELGVGKITNENISPQRKIEKEIRQKGYDKNVMGEGDKNVTRGVTELSPGGVTKMSPEEYTYNKKSISKLTRENNLTYGRGKNPDKNVTKKRKNRVSENFREAIYRKRMFEIYDNLNGLKSIEHLVQEGAERACKDIAVNRAGEFEKAGVKIDPGKVALQVRKRFPYEKLPAGEQSARRFFTKEVCDLTALIVRERFIKKREE